MKNEKYSKSSVAKGIFWAATASTLWGISGTVLQYISQTQEIDPTWFLSARTTGAGILLLIIAFIRYGTEVFSLFKSKRLIFWLILYSIFGLMANMFTFLLSIKTGNAAAATILQYLSPLFIVIGSLMFQRKLPMRSDLIAFGISLIGVFLAITKGNFNTLSVPVDSLIWGILSGVTAAFYVVLPKPIVKEHSPIIVLGWGLLISSIIFNFIHPLWVETPPITPQLIMSTATVIIVGTILAFSTLLYSLNFAPSAVVSIVDAVQPVVTFILSIIFLGLAISVMEIVGSVMVIVAIYILQRYRTEDPL